MGLLHSAMDCFTGGKLQTLDKDFGVGKNIKYLCICQYSHRTKVKAFREKILIQYQPAPAVVLAARGHPPAQGCPQAAHPTHEPGGPGGPLGAQLGVQTGSQHGSQWGHEGRKPHLGKKKSRARVSIEGHRVLLQKSPRIKMFDFFSKWPK